MLLKKLYNIVSIMSITCKDLLNLSLELVKESNNRIIENKKIQAHNLKEQKIREVNEERLLKYFDDNYLKINKKIDNINDELDSITTSSGMIVESDKLINTKLKEINNTQLELDDNINIINNKIQEKFLKEKETTTENKDLIKISGEINVVEDNIIMLKESLEEYKLDLNNLQKAKVAFEISFYLDNINNLDTSIFSKADIFKSISENSKRVHKKIIDINNEFNKIVKNAENMDNIKDYSERLSAFVENNNKYFINNDLQKIKYDTYILDVNNIINSKRNLVTNEFTNGDAAKEYFELVSNNLSKIETLIIKSQDVLKNLTDIDNSINANLFGLNDMIKQIKISNNQTNTFKSKIHDLEEKIINLGKKKTITKNINEDVNTTKIKDVKINDVKINDVKIKDVKKEDVKKEDVKKEDVKIEYLNRSCYILKRKQLDNNFNLDINNLKIHELKPMNELKNKIANLESNISKDFTKTYSTNILKIEELSVDSNDMKKTNLAQSLNIQLYYDKLPIYGQGIKNKFIFNQDNINSDVNFSDIEVTDKQVNIIDEKSAKKLAKMFYSPESKLNVKLCYYSSNKSDLIIPAYLVSGSRKNSELISTFIPASLEHLPIIKFTEVDATHIVNDNDDTIQFELTFKDFKSKNKVQYISSFENKYLDENKVIISLPKNSTKDIINQLKFIDVTLSSINEFGFIYNINLTVDLSKYLDLFNISEKKNSLSSVHNYGIEWGEEYLGSRIFLNYMNKMKEYNVKKQYSYNAQLSRKNNFIDSVDGGLDDFHVDNVDTLAYIGHGDGDGITFVTDDDDTKLSSNDAKKGNAWGDKNLEFMALMSSKVLESNHNNKNWAERWGGVFNGLHLLCGFQSSANTGEQKMLSKFAENQYSKKQSIINSWVNASNTDQPSGIESVVMGPLINTRVSDKLFNSVESAIPNLSRAYWNDKVWGADNGPGNKITKNQVKGWWRIIVTV